MDNIFGYPLDIVGPTLGVYGTLPAIRELFMFAPIFNGRQPSGGLRHVTEKIKENHLILCHSRNIKNISGSKSISYKCHIFCQTFLNPHSYKNGKFCKS